MGICHYEQFYWRSVCTASACCTDDRPDDASFVGLVRSRVFAQDGEAAIAIFFAYYDNFCRVHMTLKSMPAKAAGPTTEAGSVERLLAEASRM